MDTKSTPSLDALTSVAPADKLAEIPEINPKTVNLTKQNLQNSLVSLPTELLHTIFVHLHHDIENDEQLAKRVLNIQMKSSDTLQYLHICRTLYHKVRESIWRHVTFIVRNHPESRWGYPMPQGGDLNLFEQKVHLMDEVSRNSVRKVVFAAAHPRDKLLHEGLDGSSDLDHFLRCIKWLPKLRSILVVNVSRHVWNETYPGRYFQDEYDDLRGAIKDVFIRMRRRNELTFYTVAKDEYTVSWPGEPAARPEQRLLITPGLFIRRGAATYLFRGFQQDINEVSYKEWASRHELSNEEKVARVLQQMDHIREQTELQVVFNAVAPGPPPIGVAHCNKGEECIFQ